MFIAGVQKVSLLDYPEKISCVVFTQGCNFFCPFCHNPELNQEIAPGKINHSFIQEAEILKYLEERQNLLDAVVITGGEPFLQNDLKNFLKKVSHFNLKIKIDTNGSFPLLLDQVIQEGLADYIAMDIKTSLGKYKSLSRNKVVQVKQSIDLLLKGRVDYEFRTTVVPQLVNQEDIQKIAQLIKGAKRVYLQQFRGEKTLDVEYKNLRPYNEEKLNRFKKILQGFVQQVKIRK